MIEIKAVKYLFCKPKTARWLTNEKTAILFYCFCNVVS